MIKDFTPVLGAGFSEGVVVKSASGAFPDMGARSITLQCRFDGQTTPDFSSPWEFVYDGNKYIMPLRKPQGSKENTSLLASMELPFQHWAEYQLQQKFFFESASVGAGTVIPDKYIASVNLNFENFCTLYSRVLQYWYGDKISLDVDAATIANVTSDIQKIEISYAYVWDVLLKFHEIFGVRWQIAPGSDPDHYVIKLRHGSSLELSHIFEYGFKGGLLKVERQVQNPDIRNVILGRGGEKNLPYRYFKNVDPNNPSFPADPDWVPELAQMPFTQLHGATFRSYIRGWKAKHYGGSTTAEQCYAPWAWQRGYTDSTFNPVEFVYDADSIAFYGELWGALDDNNDIFPSIQRRTRAGIGRIDQIVDVEPITSDDYAAKSEQDAQIYNASPCKPASVYVAKNGAKSSVKIVGGSFTIPQGKVAAFDPGAPTVAAYSVPRQGSSVITGSRQEKYDSQLIASVKSISINGGNSNVELSTGSYTWTAEIEIQNTSSVDLTVTAELPKPKVIVSTPNDFTNTWCVWIKDVFNTPKPANKSATAFAADVWNPILGDHLGNEAALFFTSGILSTSEDYTFKLVKLPEYDTSKSISVDGIGQVPSMWKLTLAKSDAEFDATGKWLPSTTHQAAAGDFFAFEGIELPHEFVILAEEEIDNAKLDELNRLKEIKPTWVVSLDKVRIAQAQFDDAVALIDQIKPGAAVRLHDPRFILNAQGSPAAYETLYITNVNIEWREPSDNSPALIPDIEITLSDKYEMAASTVQRIQSEVDALTRQIGSLGNIEQVVRAVGDKLYLRKDGLADISMSPTQFFSLLTSGDFRSGVVGGAGWGFFRDANGNWVLETDRVNVRQEMWVNSLVINQVKGQGGTIIDSAAVIDEVTNVIDNPEGIYCYFDTKNGTLINQFRVNDVAYCQRYIPVSNGSSNSSIIKFYKRRVIAIGSDYIVLSKNSAEINGSGTPDKGDTIIHYGNYADANRQYVKVRDVIGGGYERYLENLNSVNAPGTEYFFIGRQAGVYNGRPRFYIGDANGYIEWVNGQLNVKAKINTLSTIGNSSIEEYVNAPANAAKAELQAKIDALQNQIDGVVESWNGQGAPSTSNYPANQWTTNEQRNAHNGDIYTDINPDSETCGQTWKWYYNSPSDCGWVKIADSDAIKALQLAQMSILVSDVYFKQADSPTTAPELPAIGEAGTITNLKGWSTDAPAWQADKYIWQVTFVKKGDGSAYFTALTCISGKNGNGIDRIEEEYYLSTSRTALQGGSWSTTRQNWVAGRFYWTRSHVYYTDGTDETIGEVCVTGEKGADGSTPFTLDLSDEMMPIPCNAAGSVTGTYPTSQATVYQGASAIPASAVNFSIAQTTGVSATITPAGLITPSALTADRGSIVIQAVIYGTTLQTTLSLYKVKPGSNYANNLIVGSEEFKTAVFASGILCIYSGSGPLAISCQAGNENWMTNWWKSLNTAEIENSFNEGDDFTISFTIKSSSANPANPTIYLKSGMGYYAMKGSISSTYSVIYYCGKWKKANSLNIHLGWGDCSGQYSIKNWKIEKGANPNPEWSPAPSEMIGQDGQDAVVYQLELSADTISRNALGQYSASELTIYKYKTTGATTRALTTEKIIRYQRIGLDTGYTQVNAGVSSTKVINLNNDLISAVIVELYDTDGSTLLDRERIPVIHDGTEMTDNLVKNSEINSGGKSDYLLGRFTTTEDLLIGSTYTFTIWGTLGSGKTFSVYDSQSINHPTNYQMQKIAEGVYSVVLQWSRGANAMDNVFNIYQTPSSVSAASTIKRIKVERGANYAPIWSRSPKDLDYLTKAMQESGSIDGGLILASLMRMGFTNDSGTYKVMAGVNGIADPDDSLAFWAGGEMIDPDKQPSATNLPKFGVRHDGSAFAAGNTIRFKPNLIEVGDYIDLDKQGLKMNINGGNRLTVGNVEASESGVLNHDVVHNISAVPIWEIPAGNDAAYYTGNGNQLYLSSKSVTAKTSDSLGAIAAKRTIILSGTLLVSVPSFTPGLSVNRPLVPKLVVQLLDGNSVRKTFNITAGASLAANVSTPALTYDLSNVLYDAESPISDLKIRFQLVNNTLTERPNYFLDISSPISSNTSSVLYARIYTEQFNQQDVAILGNNGTQFSWGNAHQCQKDGFWGIRVGKCGIRISPTRIYIMPDGENWYTIGNFITNVIAGNINWP